ncbi:glycosyltransferase [Desulfuromonas thiophila]|uniref:glycosyltransferase n=1 Tax=Desulfuromonas thiophila TaxID=57664 RepID=UPI0029F5113F|nr:glycosyltransferase [Desulfuromonas thiophila]
MSTAGKKRLIIVTHTRFWKHQNGASARICSLIVQLANSGHQIGLFFVGFLSKEDRNEINRIVYIEEIECAHDGLSMICYDFFSFNWRHFLSLPRYFVKIAFRIAGKSIPFFMFYNKGARNLFNSFVTKFYPDIVLVEYVRFSYLINEGSVGFLRIIDTHDVMYCRYEQFVRNGLVHWVSLTREEEARALDKFDYVLAIQEHEAEIFSSMVDKGKVIIVTHGVEVDPVNFSFCRNRIGYIAADNETNRDAILWFIENILPELRDVFPSLVLVVAGKICERIKSSSTNGVEILGSVSNLKDFYSCVDILVNPVRSGGGIKIKNIESLAMGVPLVTTKVGAEGFPFLNELPFVVASNKNEFVEKISELLRDDSKRIFYRDAGLEYARNHFSHAAAFGPLLNLIEDVH